MAVEGRIEAYNLPLGTLTQLFRDIAGHRAGTLTKVGLRTFVDPRQQGGKINDRTPEDLVRVMVVIRSVSLCSMNFRRSSLLAGRSA